MLNKLVTSFFMEKKFVIDRPLVFLCGPLYNPKDKYDRRNILFDEICSLSHTKKDLVFFQIIPVIVDTLFDQDFVSKNSLSYKFLEEIIANISFRTYIFLDTLSTSYELGLFDNSITNLKPISLVESGFKKRVNNPVGDYIQLSMGKERIIEYSGFRDSTNGYSCFIKNDELPKEIKKIVTNDDNELYKQLKNGFYLNFRENDILDDQVGSINYSYNVKQNKICFEMSPRTCFYYLTNSFTSVQIKKYCSIKSSYGLFKKVLNDLFVHFLNSSTVNINKSALIANNPKIQLRIGEFAESMEVLKYMALIIEKVNSDLKVLKKSGRTINKIKPVKPSLNIFKTISKNFFINLFSLTSEHIGVISKYNSDNTSCTIENLLKISGKKRKIVTYENNRNGHILREVHEHISDRLLLMHSFSTSSYAYKKGFSTKICIDSHINSSSFLKLDIHHFFQSINIKILKEQIYKLIKSKCFKTFFRYFPARIKLYEILDSVCFRNKIPLGFVSSPVLSDIYLKDFDEKIIKSLPNLIYTRYADDILISSHQDFDNKKAFEIIKDCLLELGLEINPKKRSEVVLTNYGDSIHYIGINIVKRHENNELTISKGHLLDLAEKIRQCYDNGILIDANKQQSILSYVSNISQKSLAKLKTILLCRYSICL